VSTSSYTPSSTVGLGLPEWQEGLLLTTQTDFIEVDEGGIAHLDGSSFSLLCLLAADVPALWWRNLK